MAGVLGVVACVSLSAPRGGGGVGNVPVVLGTFKGGAEQKVRIALETAAKAGTISGTGSWGLVHGDMGQRIDARAELPISFDAPRIGEITTEMGPVTAETDSFLIWNGKKYRGTITFTRSDSGFLVVNNLPMNEYLRGVVPLEIGSRTPAEFAAVQAQAVAARTYAYKHLTSSRAFDMYATVQDQVYGGVDPQQPQSGSSIVTTADIVVVYKAQPITTPYH